MYKIFPWESYVMKNNPWGMPIFIIIVAVLLSVITWIRKSKHKK